MICFTIAIDTDRPAEEVRGEILAILSRYRPQVWKGFRSENADVRAFHRKFRIPGAVVPSFLPTSALEFRLKFMHEELSEFERDHRQADMPGAADALVDLAYVVHGTAIMMGLPWYVLWDEVQRANLSKERAKNASESKRGSALDVIKPPGWRAPDHTLAIGRGPWPTAELEEKESA